jgi:hypothetical protein
LFLELPRFDEVLRRQHEPFDPLAALESIHDCLGIIGLHATVIEVIGLHGDARTNPAGVQTARRACTHLGRRETTLFEHLLEPGVKLQSSTRRAGSFRRSVRSAVHAHEE